MCDCPGLNLSVDGLCACDTDSEQSLRYRLFCNLDSAASPSSGATIANVADHVRRDGIAGNLTELEFNGGPDTILRTETFAEFTALEMLKIQFTELTYVEPQVFGSLTQLRILELSSNDKLTWLSGAPFLGLISLEELVLDQSAIEHLRETLEPFFSTITDEISLKNLQLHCDCHLLWLYDFTPSHSTVVKDAECDGEDLSSVIPIETFAQCSDVCVLGYHPCHPNATCAISPGSPNYQPTCSCKSGFRGDGIDCQQPPCECPADHMMCVGASQQCECEQGFILTPTKTSCKRTVSEALLTLAEKCYEADPVAVPQCARDLSYTTTHNLSLVGDIHTAVSLLQILVQQISADNSRPPTFDTSQDLVEVASQLLNAGNEDLWQSNNLTDSTSDVVAIFSAMNDLGTQLLTQTNISNITTDNIALVIVRLDCESEYSLPPFSGYNISSDLLEQSPPSGASSSLSLPGSLFSDVFANRSVAACSEVGVVSLVYGGIGPRLTLNDDQLLASIGCSENTTSDDVSDEVCPWYGDSGDSCPSEPEFQVNSVIISATVVNSSEAISSRLSSPVTISLAHDNTSLTSPVCVFIDEMQPLQSDDSWLTENCERDVEASSETTTVCNCYHLTSFAVVMSPSSPPPENEPLNIATKVGLSLSISCLIMTVILLFGLKLENKILHRVHRQLAIALGLAQLVFLVGVDRSSVPSPDWLCTTWAALLHYFLLATFLWQLCEGIHLYLLIGKVFGSFEKWEFAYYFFAWGLPLLIVGPTLGLRFCDYGSENYCWITPDRGTNWAFHGPVIAVLLINLLILVYVVSVIVRLTRRKDDDACLFITLIHASIVLVPILGVTWLLGFFVVGGGVYATVVEWLFFFFTTLQGVAIFFAHCVLNREVRSSFLRAIGCQRLARNQQSMVTFGRRVSNTGPSQHLKRRTSQVSGSLSVGGFTPAATPSRRESEIDNPYALVDLDPIPEESGSLAPTPQVQPKGPG
jgi:hypothetical protein